MTRDEYAKELKELLYNMKKDNISLVLGGNSKIGKQLDWIFTITDENNFIYIA